MIHNSRHIVIPQMPGLRVHAPRGTASSNWWEVSGVTCVAAYQAKGAASYAASKSNLANPGTYDAGDGAAYPSWAAGSGWSFVAASKQYLTTGITPSADSYSYIVQFTNASANSGALFGFIDSSKRAYILPFQNTVGVGYANHNTTTTVTPDHVSGNLAVTGTDCYRDGVDDGDIGNWGTGTALEIYIGAIHRSALITNYFTGSIYALAIYSSTLTSTQVGTLATAMAAL